MANDRGLPVTPKTTKPATKPRPATIRKTSRRAPTSYAETLYIATSSPSPATPGLKPSNTLAPKATATRRRTRLGYRRRQSSGTTCNSKRRRPTTTTVTAPPGRQTQEHQHEGPAAVEDAGADIGPERPLWLEDVERIGPGVERRVKEEHEQQTPPRAVVEPGRNDRECNRAHKEQREGQVA